MDDKKDFNENLGDAKTKCDQFSGSVFQNTKPCIIKRMAGISIPGKALFF